MATTGAERYRQAANVRFKALLESKPDYWKTANAFDTMLDFLHHCSQDANRSSDAAKAAQWLIGHKASSPKGIWFDDYGWWTIAASRALAPPFSGYFTANVQTQLRGIAGWCWHQFTANAPFVYDRRPQKPEEDPFKDCEPAVSHGVWNGYWEGTDEKWDGPKEGNPHTDTFKGIQNTVTNAVYLLSALARQDKDAAKNEWMFLNSWFTLKTTDPLKPAYPLIDDKSGVVRERVSCYKYNKDAPGFHPEWAWTGDQGLILQALVAKSGPNSPDPLVTRAEKLLHGVRDHMVQDHMLKPWIVTSDLPNGYEDDYSTGTGVFWRSALRVWELGKMHLALKEFKTVLQNGAEAAIAKTPPSSSSQPWVTLTNDLAVLVAAYVMLPQLEG